MFHSIFLLYLATAAYGVAGRSSTILPDVLIENRIIGGDQTSIEKFPYQIALLKGSNFLCGGSIIRKDVILTAAHCTHFHPESSYSIRAGSSYHARGGTIRKVAKIHEHENFRKSIRRDYDYCILFLSISLKFGPTIRTIALPRQGQEIDPKTQAVATGWGLTTRNGKASNVLREVYLLIVSREKCVPLLRPDPVTDRMICAGPKKGGKGTCKGDSGGPLVANNELIGITSWAHSCDKTVGVYAKVSYVVDWINNKISSK